MRIWNVDTGECEKTLEVYSGTVWSVCAMEGGRIATDSPTQPPPTPPLVIVTAVGAKSANGQEIVKKK